MDAEGPLVSVVIPAYNHARYIEEALLSVLNQTYTNIELIVLDDGSTDDTPEILKRYPGRFYWESQPNMGQAFTLNKGWQMARGKLLSYLSADDVLLPDAVGSAVECLFAKPHAVLTYCDFNLIDPSSRLIRKVITPDFAYKQMLVDVTCPPGPGVVFRRSAFEAAGLWNALLRQMPDYEYWLRLGLEGEFVRIPRVLAGFRIHESSQTFSQTSEERAEEPVRIIAHFFDNARVPAELKKLKDQSLSSAYLVSAQLHVRAGRYRKGLKNLGQALALYPGNIFRLGMARMLLNAFVNRIGHGVVWRLKALASR